MKYINYSVNTGLQNMQTDENLLNNAVKNSEKEPLLRLYGWNPKCISLGRNQDEKFLDKNLLKKYDIDCVRRLTGGRALLHDMELTYSFIAPIKNIPNGESIIDSYKFISGIWIQIFGELGIELTIGGLEPHIGRNNYCMSVSTGADLCYKSKKFIGSAQYRKNGYILQHGSILLDYDKKLINEVFNEDTDFDTIITLKEISKNLSPLDIINAAKSFISNPSVYC